MEEVFRRARPKPDKKTSHILLEFGHFLVQDMLGSSMNTSEPWEIPCDGQLRDFLFCPVTGQRWPDDGTATNATASDLPGMDFFRLTHVTVPDDAGISNNDDDGDDVSMQQQQQPTRRASVNSMTAFLDLSNIYGVTEESEQRMRRKEGGLLTLDDDGLIPRENIYIQGMNTSPGVFALYIVFMRYHNHVATEIRDAHNGTVPLTDEELYQSARRRTIAVYQSFVEEKYLPTLLGYKLEPYGGYDPKVDPSIDEFFAAVSFRYAHTSLSGMVRVLDANFAPTPADPLYLRDVFKQGIDSGNDILSIVKRHGGVEPFVRGMTVVAAKGHDASFVDDVNIWSEATSVLDVQRGRDVGIPPYNAIRRAMGLAPAGTFEELVGATEGGEAADDPGLVPTLRALYGDDVELVDAYVGALVEPHSSSMDTMGPLFTQSIMDQFTRLRDGDRFWYRNVYPPEEYEAFPILSELIKLLCTDMDLFPDDPYVLYHPPAPSGDAVCSAATSNNNHLNLLE
jgi:peroxidase